MNDVTDQRNFSTEEFHVNTNIGYRQAKNKLIDSFFKYKPFDNKSRKIKYMFI